MPRLPVQTAGTPLELRHTEQGEGAPVVLIHGWPLSSRSSEPWTGYDDDTSAADLAPLLTHLDLTGVTPVGFSTGRGEVVRHLGTYGSGRVAGAVLASAVPPCLDERDDDPDGGLDDATIEQFETGVPTDRPAFLEGFATAFCSAGSELQVSAAQARQPSRSPSPRRPRARRTASLVIHGDSDGVVPFEG